MSETIQVPKGWKIVKFEDVGDKKHPYPIGDGDHGQIKPGDYSNEGIPYIRVADIVDDQIVKNKLAYIPNSVHDQNKKSHLFPGDILIAKTGATIGKVAIIPDWCKQANTTSSVGKISVDEEQIMSKFLYYFIKSNNFKKQMWAVSGKTAQPGFGIINLKKFVLPLPLLSIQEKIVQKLDEILGQLEEKKKQILEYQQTIFKKLQLISENQEKRESRRTGLFQFYTNMILQKAMDNLDYTFDDLNNICSDILDTPHTTVKYTSAGICVIRTTDISHEKINFSNTKFTSKEAFEERRKKIDPLLNDILYTREAPWGMAALVKRGNFVVGQRIILLRVKQGKILPGFLSMILNSSFGYNQALSVVNKTTSQHINIKHIKKFQIPVFSLPEQHKLLDQITEKTNSFQKVDQRISKLLNSKNYSLKLLENIQPSILDAAFLGKLVN